MTPSPIQYVKIMIQLMTRNRYENLTHRKKIMQIDKKNLLIAYILIHILYHSILI